MWNLTIDRCCGEFPAVRLGLWYDSATTVWSIEDVGAQRLRTGTSWMQRLTVGSLVFLISGALTIERLSRENGAVRNDCLLDLPSMNNLTDSPAESF